MAVAQLSALLANINKKKGAKPASREDFLPYAKAWEVVEAAIDPAAYEAKLIRQELGSQGRIVKVDRETRQPIQ